MTTYTHNETPEQRRERLTGWVYEARNLQGRRVSVISATFDKVTVADQVYSWIKYGLDVHLVDTNEASVTEEK